MKLKIVLLVFLSGLLSIVLSRPVFGAEVDATTAVSGVIDGDTFDTTTQGRIRLADIDAPEYYEPGYSAAKQCLEELIDGKTVYLDIDDVHQTDPYDRYVCVVYVEYSTTQFKNVNKALLVEGVAVIDDYSNEFNPYSWTLYVSEDEIPEFPSPITFLLFLLASLIAVLLYRRRIVKCST